MIVKDIWLTLQHILRDKQIELSLDQINRYLELANEELKSVVYGRVREQDGFETEAQITRDLLPFKTVVNVALSSGSGSMPEDFWQKVVMEVTSTGVQVLFETDREALRKRNNSITVPTADYPIVILKDSTFQVYPTTISAVDFTYLKTGDVPEIAVQFINGVQQYDGINSTQPEWDTVDKYIDLIRIILGYLNIPMDNNQILSYTEQKVTQEN